MTGSLLITNARLVTPTSTLEPGWLLTDAGKIALLGHGDAPDFPDARRFDAGGRWLLPGFIDVHVHGAAGHEAMDANAGGLHAMARFYAQHGVTSFLATTWTDSHQRIDAALRMIAQHSGAQPHGATILGAHLEGPYLNAEKCGAQNPAHVRRADRAEALGYLEYGVIRLLAVAPEFTENHWLIRECARRGIAVSAAHTSATYAQMRAAIPLGLTQTTHTFNAMTGLHHREPGGVGAALTSPELRCEVIADNIHVHPAVLNLLWLAKGHDRTILITDAIRGAGLPDGDYPVDDRMVSIRSGIVTLPDGTLAGSTLTFDRALRNFQAATGAPISALWQTSSLNAARAIGIAGRKGSLEVGKDADLVVFDDQIHICLTVAEGRVVYEAGA